MKNPKLIDEAWIDEQIQYVGNPNNKYDDALLHVMNLVKSKLQPLSTKNNVEKVRAGEMAIENDDKEVLKKCCVYLFDYGRTVEGNYKYYYAWEKYLNRWQANNTTDLPTIKASELIKEIEGAIGAERYTEKKEQTSLSLSKLQQKLDEALTKETPDTLIKWLEEKRNITKLQPEWQPKFGEVVEVAMERHQRWHERIFLFNYANYYYCVDVISEDSFKSIGETIKAAKWHLIRPKQTPTLTLAEAEAKLGVKIVMP